MIDHHKMVYGCAICNTSKYFQESLNAWQQKQLEIMKDKADNSRVQAKVYLQVWSILYDACSDTPLERREGGGEVEGGNVGVPNADLKFLQSISNIREELEAHGEKPLAKGVM